MNNLGAIPKNKGGARPKTKIVSNGQISNNFQGHLNSYKKTKPINSVDGLLTDEYNPEINRYKRKSYSNAPDDGQQILFEDVTSSGKPVEEQEILFTDNGVQLKRPALSAAWVEERIFIHYIRPPLPDVDSFVEGATEAWIEQMEFLIDDLYWLLNLPHHRFWSQVIHDRSVQECLETYLGNGPRWYDSPTIPQDPDSGVSPVINKIHQAVFLVYLRLSTYKESKDDFISPEAFANLVYDNFLYDICKCLDLCVLYGSTNPLLLQKMISNIFVVQPKYYEDLALLVDTMRNVLDTLERKLCIYDPMLPRSVCPEDIALTLEELQDLVRYVQDTFCSLHAFLSIFPEACPTFHQKEFAPRLSVFYGKAIPKMLELLAPIEEEGEEEWLLRRRLRHELATARVNALALFRDILAWSCFREGETPTVCGLDVISKGVESFTHLLTSSFEDKVFIVDYNGAFSLDQDIAYFQEKGADMTPLNFVKEAVESIVNEMNLSCQKTVDKEVATALQRHSTVDDTSGMNGYYVGETTDLSDVEVTSLVSSIQDLLPNLGDGFIKECLRYYNYSSEETLNALLEDKLPSALDTLDRALKATELSQKKDRPSPVGAPDETAGEENGGWESPLCNRLNVYDDDEFDVFRRPATLDKSKIHKGKGRTRDPPLGGLEKDPELAVKMKRILHEYESKGGYSIYEDEEKYSPLVATETVASSSGDYNDEYDDTYDDDDTGDVDGGFLDQDRRRRAAASFISMRGRGALNTPGMNFVEEVEEETDGERRNFAEDCVKEGRPHPAANFKRNNAFNRRGGPPSPGQDTRNPRGGGSSMVFTNSTRGWSSKGRGEREEAEPVASRGEETRPRPTSFEPFCENPQEIRHRFERKKMAMNYRNKGYNQQPSSGRDREESGFSGEPGARFATKSTKHSGKNWRQGTQGEDSDNRTQGGKYKESSTNHGKAQDRNYRYKMMHKNEQRRNAAQAKYRNNF